MSEKFFDIDFELDKVTIKEGRLVTWPVACFAFYNKISTIELIGKGQG